MYSDGEHLDVENRQLEEENRRLDEENRQLEELNKQLERNRQLKDRRKQLEEKRKQLVEEGKDLKNNKRKVDVAFDKPDGHGHYGKTGKRTRLHDVYMKTAAKTFFSAKQFGVVGASSDPSKYGNKVFAWYLHHKLPVTPINPSSPMVTTMSGPKLMLKRVHLAVAAPSRLSSPSETSLSIITPPKVTRTVLQDAKKAGVPAIWLQPGSFDSEILQYARREWPSAVIAGTDIPGSAGEDGWCVLVDGEAAMSVAGRLI